MFQTENAFWGVFIKFWGFRSPALCYKTYLISFLSPGFSNSWWKYFLKGDRTKFVRYRWFWSSSGTLMFGKFLLLNVRRRSIPRGHRGHPYKGQLLGQTSSYIYDRYLYMSDIQLYIIGTYITYYVLVLEQDKNQLVVLVFVMCSSLLMCWRLGTAK